MHRIYLYTYNFYSNTVKVPKIIHVMNLKVTLYYFISIHLDQNRNESDLNDKCPTIPVISCK